MLTGFWPTLNRSSLLILLLSPFPKYIQDLTAGEKQLATEHAARLRAQLVALLEARNVALPGPTISSRHSVLTCLGYIDIAVEELKPRYLGGYGPVPVALVPELNRSVEEVQATAKAAILALKDAIQGEEREAPGTGGENMHDG